MCDCRFWCDDENFAYFVVDDNGKGSRLLIRSGGGMPLIISSETFFKNSWHVQSIYLPKFCPECGRKLEDYNET